MDTIKATIEAALDGLPKFGTRKIGQLTLQPLLEKAIEKAGFTVDYEDRRGFLGAGLPVWRSKDTGKIEMTSGRRRIDLVVYTASGKEISLIETESDLDDLRQSGISTRNGHYDVYSIAGNLTGKFFHSYKSLERMAAAAFYHAAKVAGSFDWERTPAQLESVRSEDPAVHNPSGIELFLVTGRCRITDKAILAPRLRSLGATLIVAS